MSLKLAFIKSNAFNLFLALMATDVFRLKRCLIHKCFESRILQRCYNANSETLRRYYVQCGYKYILYTLAAVLYSRHSFERSRGDRPDDTTHVQYYRE